MRTAEIKDLKSGNTITNQYGNWEVIGLANGFSDVWEIRGRSGVKLLYTYEVKHYQVNN